MNMEKPVSRPRTDGVEEQMTAAIERSELRHRPFDHIYMEDVLDPATYEALLGALPDRRFYHELRHHDAMRSDGSSTRLRLYLYPELVSGFPKDQRDAWLPVARALSSKGLERAFKTKFRDALEKRFGKSIDRIRLYPIPILLRDQPGYRIGIHADVPTKAITVQFYLPSDSSQKHVGTIFHEGRDGEAAKRTTQMPFVPSSGYAFPVTAAKSWHSAATTCENDGERVSMMVTYYVAEGAWRWLKLRLRRVGLRFGIHPKG